MEQERLEIWEGSEQMRRELEKLKRQQQKVIKEKKDQVMTPSQGTQAEARPAASIRTPAPAAAVGRAQRVRICFLGRIRLEDQ